MKRAVTSNARHAKNALAILARGEELWLANFRLKNEQTY